MTASVYSHYTHRNQIYEVFCCLAHDDKFLTASDLLRFLRSDQFNTEADNETAVQLIESYEPDEQVRKNKKMTFEGFLRFMNSPDCSVFNRDHQVVYQDMGYPLCDYFISSSHNTYLIADQLVGPSHLWGYISALMRGCRCLEIDCWDGPMGEPIVYHGYTLTSKILFSDVIWIIERHAFEVLSQLGVLPQNHPRQKTSTTAATETQTDIARNEPCIETPHSSEKSSTPIDYPTCHQITSHFTEIGCQTDVVTSEYPLILSLENHCTPKQQERMADHLITILGEKLLDMTINQSFPKELPSPQELKKKILIKNKKIGQLQDTILKKGINRHGEVGEYLEDVDPEEEFEETPVVSKGKKKPGGKETKNKAVSKVQKVTLAMELSDLVIYTKSVKFISFEHSRSNQKFYENTSIGEVKARKLVKQSAQEFLLHNVKFITRIYPKGTRTSSSNFNPQEFWNVGSQMVALNFQSHGLPMDLQNGKFQGNGACGYILKPEFMRKEYTGYNPASIQHGFKPISLLIKVISGCQLPVNVLSKENSADPLVKVEIHGAAVDNAKQQTNVVKNNALNPRWNDTLTFTVQVPELALVRFVVEHQNLRTGNEFLAQYTLPLTSMKKGVFGSCSRSMFHMKNCLPVLKKECTVSSLCCMSSIASKLQNKIIKTQDQVSSGGNQTMNVKHII